MTDRLQTQLCDLLGCRYPIIQAGMGGVARAELAAAVSAAGGFGCLGMVRESPETIAREVTALRARTDKPFAVNLIPSSTDPKLFAEEFAACKDLGVKAMINFWDVVPAAVAEAKAAGMQVLYQVGSVEQARLAADAGADAIIAQGLEAGVMCMGRSLRSCSCRSWPGPYPCRSSPPAVSPVAPDWWQRWRSAPRAFIAARLFWRRRNLLHMTCTRTASSKPVPRIPSAPTPMPSTDPRVHRYAFSPTA